MSASVPNPVPATSLRNRFIFLGVAFWLLLGLIGLKWLLPDISRAGSVVAVGIWFVAGGVLAHDWLASLFGPVLMFDLLRTGRRKKLFIDRTLFASAMAIVFTWLYLSWNFSNSRYQKEYVDPNQLAELASTFFLSYAVIQFVAVCLFVPGQLANAISDEKERRTLEFMLATDLRDREIVFGKFVSRLGGVLMHLFAGLPILSLVQFFGGIEPGQLLASFATTLMTTLSLSALALACSVLCRKSRDAIAMSYLAAIAYCIFSGIAYSLIYRAGLIDFGFIQLTGEDVAYVVVCGNPFIMLPEFIGSRSNNSDALFTGTMHYMGFHLVAFILLMTWSGLRLRPIALAQTFGGPKRTFIQRLTRHDPNAPVKRQKPEIGDWPVVWKEIYIESEFRLNLVFKLMVALLVLASFWPVFVTLAEMLIHVLALSNSTQNWAEYWESLSKSSNIYARTMTPIVSTMLFLAMAIRGAGSILGERDRQSLDVLLTTPLSAKEIIWGKWFGCMLGLRWLWIWLGTIWVVCLIAGGLSLFVLPLLIASTVIYAAGFAWLGIFCSVTSRNVQRATSKAISFSLLLGGFYLVFLACGCLAPMQLFSSGSDNGLEVVFDVAVCFSPVVNQAWLAVPKIEDLGSRLIAKENLYAPFWLFGTFAWAAFAFQLSQLCLERFRKDSNRNPIEIKEPSFQEE